MNKLKSGGNYTEQEIKTIIEWMRSDDPPATSNRYLVYSFLVGWSYYADYDSLKRRWTTGEGMDKEEDNHIDFWTFSPEPDVMPQTTV